MTAPSPFQSYRYRILTLDPLHVGTGGYRLGRVDSAIVREPGTDLPKIPGSSLCGALRAGVAMAVQSQNEAPVEKSAGEWLLDYARYRSWKYLRPRYRFVKEKGDVKLVAGKAIIEGRDGHPATEDDAYDSCAGKGGEGGEGHCAASDCPVCMAFGFSKGTTSFQGLAQVSDARILLFPVRSMLGPVWVTSPGVLSEHGAAPKPLAPAEVRPLQVMDGAGGLGRTISIPPGGLNLGWLFLAPGGQPDVLPPRFSSLPPEMTARALLVSNEVFSRLVNDNLEVRTSVAIDPATGAAKEHALYTYEAIPRATMLWMDIVYSDPKYFRVDTLKSPRQKIMSSPSQEADLAWVKGNLEQAFPLLQSLGVGGMNTRGMGRIEIKEWL